MKKTLITATLFLVATLSFARFPDIRVVPETAVGRIIATQEEIKAREYIFPERINDVCIDTVSGSIVVQLLGWRNNGKRLRNRGELVVCDIAGEKVKWSEKMAYHKNSIHLYGSTVIRAKTGIDSKIRALNIETGEKLWQAVNTLSFVDPLAQIGIGYKYTGSGKYDNKLEGIDLQTGKAMWQREINREYGWSGVFQLSDSVRMIIADGLHTVNVHDGSGWSHHAVTGKKDYRAATAMNMVGIASGLLTGTFFFTTGHNLVSNVHSNVYADSTGYYWASKEKLSRIRNDGGGTEYWWSLLPEKASSKSSIFAKGDTLYMINHGYAFMDGRLISFGKPFFAAYGKNNGWQLFYHPFDDHKKNPVLDFKIENDQVWLIFKDRIMKRSLRDGSLILEKSIATGESGELQFFVGDRLYVDTGNETLTELSLSDTSRSYILSTNGKVLIFDAELNITGDIDKSLLYFTDRTTGDYKFVDNDHHTIVLDAGNSKVAELGMAGKTYRVGNKLYSIREKSLIEIDAIALMGHL